MDRDEMLRVLRAFDREGLNYALVGAAAMGLHGVVRATAENVDRLKRAFRAAYADDPNIDEIRAEDLLGDYPAVRYWRSLLRRDDASGRGRELRDRRAGRQACRGNPREGRDPRGALPAEDGNRQAARPAGRGGPAAPVIVPPGEGFERFARQCARYWKIAPRIYPRGVFRFPSIVEAQAARERVTDDNVARLRAAASTSID